MSPIALPSQHAAVLYGPKDLRFEERTLWPPQFGQAQVKVVSTGLCGSDRMSFHIHPHVSSLLTFIQCTTTWQARMAISPCRPHLY